MQDTQNVTPKYLQMKRFLNNYNKHENTNTSFIETQQNFNDSNTLSNNNQLESQTYIQSLEIPMHSVSSIEVAELTKIIENSHRYLQIAFAEELYLYCQANNILFSELRDALNTKWNVEILEPRDGIRRTLSTKRYKNVSYFFKNEK